MEKNSPQITANHLKEKGFTVERFFSEKDQYFRLKFETEGYDCKLILSPTPFFRSNDSGFTPPEYQVEQMSSIEWLSENHTGDWQVYINDFSNHFTTIRRLEQLGKLLYFTDPGSY